MTEKGVVDIFILVTIPCQNLFTPGCCLVLDQYSLNFMAGLANVKAIDLTADLSFRKARFFFCVRAPKLLFGFVLFP